MKRTAALASIVLILPNTNWAKDFIVFQRQYDERSFESSSDRIDIARVDNDVRFSITLRSKTTGLERRHEFDAPVPEMPTAYLVVDGYYCDEQIILFTVEYPWRHHFMQYNRRHETYAFRASDFAFIDVTNGTAPEIALPDSGEISVWENMLPPVRVHCLPDSDDRIFEFIESGYLKKL